ncbi:MAG: iron-containing alcohol dehydrogenase, partial [Candidatus Omnitrophica bacterium]|nr:iron-containing alcohol dehydrogenase [Candidatus Omnitrophota bacterium]
MQTKKDDSIQPFWFCLNTKVYFGCGIVDKYIPEIKKLGNKVLIVTGKRSAKASGLLERVERKLRETGVKYFEFTDVEENPTFQTLQRG